MLKLPQRDKRRTFGDPLPSNPLERDIRREAMGAINRLPWARVWENQEHVYTRPDGRRVYLPGLCVGSADLVGIVARYTYAGLDPVTLESRSETNGVFLAIEMKRPKRGRRSAEQEAWIDTVRRMGGVAGFARTMGEALDLVADARGVTRACVVLEIEGIAGRSIDLG